MRRREEGQISLLILGLTVVAIMLIIGTVVVTSIQLARVRLYAVSDALALDAADELDEGAYDAGLPNAVPVNDATVRQAAAKSLAATDLPVGVSSWSLQRGTGSPDGTSAVVVLRGEVDVPFLGGVMDTLGSSIGVTVTSRASAGVRP